MRKKGKKGKYIIENVLSSYSPNELISYILIAKGIHIQKRLRQKIFQVFMFKVLKQVNSVSNNQIKITESMTRVEHQLTKSTSKVRCQGHLANQVIIPVQQAAQHLLTSQQQLAMQCICFALQNLNSQDIKCLVSLCTQLQNFKLSNKFITIIKINRLLTQPPSIIY